MTAGIRLHRSIRLFESTHRGFDQSLLRALRATEALHRRPSSALMLPGSCSTLNTMALFRRQNPITSKVVTQIAAAPTAMSGFVPPARMFADRVSMPHLAPMRHMLESFSDGNHRLIAAHSWLHDAIDLATPRTVRGLAKALPGHRKRVDEEAAAGKQTREGLLYRNRCAADSPGQLVTARRRVPRGPNTRLLTEISHQAG
ncbi:hypothetical protein ACWFPY_35130 [Nocardia fluminea]